MNKVKIIFDSIVKMIEQQYSAADQIIADTKLSDLDKQIQLHSVYNCILAAASILESIEIIDRNCDKSRFRKTSTNALDLIYKSADKIREHAGEI